MEYRKNSKLEVTITDTGTQGEGIGKVDGYTLFVKDAVMGDTVLASITKPKKTYAYARCEKVLAPSPFRVTAPCSFHKQCGGCQIMALSYEKQLAFKQEKVKNNLIRIGGFEEAFLDRIMEPIRGMDEPFHYRNKAQYPVAPGKDGRPVAGFYAGRTHSVIANTDCRLGARCDGLILNTVLRFMEENGIPAYDETTQTGLVRHVLIRTGFTTGQIMVCLVINGTDLPGSKALVQRLCALRFDVPKTTMMQEDADYRIASVSLSVNTENTNVIMGRQIQLLYGEEFITDHIADVAFQISPLSFFQVNPAQTRVLYETALAFADLTGNESVWDLYCGIGTISLFLSRRAGMVYGVETVEQAVSDARKNAGINGIDNVRFFVGKAEEVLPAFYERYAFRQSGAQAPEDAKADMQAARAASVFGEQTKYADSPGGDVDMLHPDVIVVDPPRKGCDNACLDTMLKMAPKKIVYVSCDSATLARDLGILCAGGYRLERVQPVDMFPMTVHVEVVVMLSRAEGEVRAL